MEVYLIGGIVLCWTILQSGCHGITITLTLLSVCIDILFYSYQVYKMYRAERILLLTSHTKYSICSVLPCVTLRVLHRTFMWLSVLSLIVTSPLHCYINPLFGVISFSLSLFFKSASKYVNTKWIDTKFERIPEDEDSV